VIYTDLVTQTNERRGHSVRVIDNLFVSTCKDLLDEILVKLMKITKSLLAIRAKKLESRPSISLLSVMLYSGI